MISVFLSQISNNYYSLNESETNQSHGYGFIHSVVPICSQNIIRADINDIFGIDIAEIIRVSRVVCLIGFNCEDILEEQHIYERRMELIDEFKGTKRTYLFCSRNCMLNYFDRELKEITDIRIVELRAKIEALRQAKIDSDPEIALSIKRNDRRAVEDFDDVLALLNESKEESET